MQPLVCIILVNYNGFSDTVDCVKSLLNIGYDNYKIIVVDNGSTLSLDAQQREFLIQNTDFIETGENLGFSGGNNFGMRYSKKYNPDYFLLLNNDTEVEPDFLSILINCAEKENNVGIVCGKILWFSEKNKIWYAGGEFDYNEGKASHTLYDCIDSDFSNTITKVSFATGCLWLLPVSIIERLGYMDERMFLYAEDTEYSCRVLKGGFNIYYCNASVIYHKVSRSTGAGSKNTQYYTVRNNLKVIMLYGNRKIITVLKRLFYFIKEVIRGRMDAGPVFCGIVDFALGKYGKKQK